MRLLILALFLVSTTANVVRYGGRQRYTGGYGDIDGYEQMHGYGDVRGYGNMYHRHRNRGIDGYDMEGYGSMHGYGRMGGHGEMNRYDDTGGFGNMLGYAGMGGYNGIVRFGSMLRFGGMSGREQGPMYGGGNYGMGPLGGLWDYERRGRRHLQSMHPVYDGDYDPFGVHGDLRGFGRIGGHREHRGGGGWHGYRGVTPYRNIARFDVNPMYHGGFPRPGKRLMF
ncbi:keratin, type II cytoskeletal 2 epidermal-like [Dreissena polymorpha]|uniref:Uncharacterized protein n=1 Tax=Dreissena polymorpha TaxID=45954 RepID=A0A9D4F0X4_DREPO|nr:keratin, type II cytoskeletal 2 epidermal-like [Dreissena polymorpha]KAH3789013.1 hypothetical protein DPMN_167180 [Dreissena polymorpha]